MPSNLCGKTSCGMNIIKDYCQRKFNNNRRISDFETITTTSVATLTITQQEELWIPLQNQPKSSVRWTATPLMREMQSMTKSMAKNSSYVTLISDQRIRRVKKISLTQASRLTFLSWKCASSNQLAFIPCGGKKCAQTSPHPGYRQSSIVLMLSSSRRPRTLAVHRQVTISKETPDMMKKMMRKWTMIRCSAKKNAITPRPALSRRRALRPTILPRARKTHRWRVAPRSRKRRGPSRARSWTWTTSQWYSNQSRRKSIESVYEYRVERNE